MSERTTPPDRLFPLIRHLSWHITPPVARLPVTPNQITVASFLLGLLGASLLALADSSWWIAGGLLIQFASILDGCDGEIARLKKNASARGAWLDTMLDRYADAGCFGGQLIQTPNIDVLAKEGTRFTNCYAGSTVCAPSRSVLMTGLHTGHTRVRGNFGVGGVVGLGGGKGRVPLHDSTR